MKLEALDHPKTLDFAARLGIELPTAIGHLELLWAFVGKKAPQGDIGKWPDGAIARACYWNADPTVFVTALANAGFIDAHTAYRYVVHDWHEHVPRWVLSKLSRAKLKILNCSRDCSGDSSPESSRDCSGDSVREGKGRDKIQILPSPQDSDVSAARNARGASPGIGEGEHVNGKPRGHRASRGTAIPTDFALSDTMREQALSRYPDCDVAEMFTQFRAHHEAHGKAMKSWPAAWVTWLGNAAKFGYPKRGAGGVRWE